MGKHLEQKDRRKRSEEISGGSKSSNIMGCSEWVNRQTGSFREQQYKKKDLPIPPYFCFPQNQFPWRTNIVKLEENALLVTVNSMNDKARSVLLDFLLWIFQTQHQGRMPEVGVQLTCVFSKNWCQAEMEKRKCMVKYCQFFVFVAFPEWGDYEEFHTLSTAQIHWTRPWAMHRCFASIFHDCPSWHDTDDIRHMIVE